ncbi:YdcF family protein [Stenotrophomonas sp. 24(2023)]|uniref:YdcF family protein n=1 Tax=Stenotrophomonas sp. 24(2023) TaxID=3068324 RepID=UPI0027DEC6E5|nr:YdcF family protein [Stenotrophomonas sp. 24(2023)]WMJ71238.1 YdcF family protein [Stenotrophomonas sp. 24(2023)]
MRVPVATMLALLLGSALSLQATAQDRSSAALAGRLFPTLLQLQPDTLPAAARGVLAQRRQQLARCGQQVACTLEAAAWTPAQIDTLASAAPDRSAAIGRELRGLNGILAVYGHGEAPRYAAIDGPTGTAGSPRLAQDVLAAVQMSDVDQQAAYTALDRSIALAVGLLDANDRLDAIRFEPISEGTNAAAFARARGLDWKACRYTAIIVLGQGPDELTTPISAGSKLRLKAAAQRYLAGDAPYLIVSGGAVHPRGTRSVEALQMRQALIERFGIPEASILIEPYARHTTTNLRNASRLLAALQAPSQQPALVVSSPAHIDSVASAQFSERNRSELGYLPGTVGERVSPYAIRFVPAAASLRIDPADPLDP